MDLTAGQGCLNILKWLVANRPEGGTTAAMDNAAGMDTWTSSSGSMQITEKAAQRKPWTLLLGMGTWKSSSGFMQIVEKAVPDLLR